LKKNYQEKVLQIGTRGTKKKPAFEGASAAVIRLEGRKDQYLAKPSGCAVPIRITKGGLNIRETDKHRKKNNMVKGSSDVTPETGKKKKNIAKKKKTETRANSKNKKDL